MATPAALFEHIPERHLRKLKTVVLDEVDTLLTGQSGDQLKSDLLSLFKFATVRVEIAMQLLSGM